MIRKTDVLFLGHPVYVDDTMPPGRLDYMRVDPRTRERQLIVGAMSNVGLLTYPGPIEVTTTRPLQIGEWPWDEEGNSR